MQRPQLGTTIGTQRRVTRIDRLSDIDRPANRLLKSSQRDTATGHP